MDKLFSIKFQEGVNLLLVRHFESIKNIRGSFSSAEDKEPLTKQGIDDAMNFCNKLVKWASQQGVTARNVYASNSIRAISSAKIIGECLGIKVKHCNNLRSTNPGELAGHSEKDAWASNPLFMEQLQLYRSGLFCSYHFNVARGKEDKREFEARVATAVDNVLSEPNETLKIIVTHRSPITATLIRFARNVYKYPKDFFGYVPLDLGGISRLEYKSEKWHICEVNMQSNIVFCGS